jgi:catechol 2,3-dioxygenase-like lactoylglutathione lyase family enzyme
MRIDHVAYRVKNRHKTAEFFIECFGYRIDRTLPEGFKIKFDDGSETDCLVLLPPEHNDGAMPWTLCTLEYGCEYHLAPEIFISDGEPGSIVGDWVERRNGVGGLHHIAYQVDSVQQTMFDMMSKGYAEFTTEDPLECPGLKQAFTKPSELTGVIYEFIERENYGFCKENVKDLMNSTKGLE